MAIFTFLTLVFKDLLCYLHLCLLTSSKVTAVDDDVRRIPVVVTRRGREASLSSFAQK